MTTTTHQTASRPEGPDERTDGPVHLWFSLSYANFLVWHRAHMQSMPLEWQQRFVELAEELDAAYPDGAGVDYEVNTVRSLQIAEMTPEEMRAAGVFDASDDEEADDDERSVYDREFYRNGQTLSAHARAGIPVPDPVPHYNRGRTYLPPDEDAIAALKAARTAELAAEPGVAVTGVLPPVAMAPGGTGGAFPFRRLTYADAENAPTADGED